jgi:predicted alpha/beta superfamily hydrolase
MTDSATASWTEYGEARGGRPHTVSGSVQVLADLHSPELGDGREILAYLPPSYRTSDRRYPVLYMHDGQNLFDASTSFSGEWGVDETMQEASRAGIEAIVVGIPNAGERRTAEYSPFEDDRFGGGEGDAYLDFILRTLKPRIDADFRTLPGREHTGLFGSSLGGLISIYGFFRHPDHFGFVGAMSPAFWFAERAIFPFVRGAPFNLGRIYLDVGTEEGAHTVRDTRRMRTLLHTRGYDSGHQLLYVEDRGADHSERAWRRRLGRSLHFLLRPLAERRRSRR